jgi:hypothetical protein
MTQDNSRKMQAGIEQDFWPHLLAIEIERVKKIRL